MKVMIFTKNDVWLVSYVTNTQQTSSPAFFTSIQESQEEHKDDDY